MVVTSTTIMVSVYRAPQYGMVVKYTTIMVSVYRAPQYRMVGVRLGPPSFFPSLPPSHFAARKCIWQLFCFWIVAQVALLPLANNMKWVTQKYMIGAGYSIKIGVMFWDLPWGSVSKYLPSIENALYHTCVFSYSPETSKLTSYSYSLCQHLIYP